MSTTTTEAPALLKRSEAARMLGVSLYRLDAWLQCPEIFEPGSWCRSATGRIWIQRYAVERLGSEPFRPRKPRKADRAARAQQKREADMFWEIVGR